MTKRPDELSSQDGDYCCAFYSSFSWLLSCFVRASNQTTTKDASGYNSSVKQYYSSSSVVSFGSCVLYVRCMQTCRLSSFEPLFIRSGGPRSYKTIELYHFFAVLFRYYSYYHSLLVHCSAVICLLPVALS